jgi:hypothetical protein
MVGIPFSAGIVMGLHFVFIIPVYLLVNCVMVQDYVFINESIINV